MDYIYSHEKKSLNRNSLMKPLENYLSFEHLLGITKKIFTHEGGLKERQEEKSFLDELIESNEDLGTSKLIIVVPSTFNEGNLCKKNAKEFYIMVIMLIFWIRMKENYLQKMIMKKKKITSNIKY